MSSDIGSGEYLTLEQLLINSKQKELVNSVPTISHQSIESTGITLRKQNVPKGNK